MLGEYIDHLKYHEFFVLHQKLSYNKVEFAIFTLKTLLRYLGAYPLRWNAKKVMLLEKNAVKPRFKSLKLCLFLLS